MSLVNKEKIVINSHKHENVDQIAVCKQMLHSLFILNFIFFDQSSVYSLNFDLTHILEISFCENSYTINIFDVIFIKDCLDDMSEVSKKSLCKVLYRWLCRLKCKHFTDEKNIISNKSFSSSKIRSRLFFLKTFFFADCIFFKGSAM